MEKNNTDIQDIYHTEGPKPENTERSWTVQELMARETRRKWFFNLFTSLFVFILVFVVVSKYLFAPEEIASPIGKSLYIASYTLPEDEQWAIEYRQVAAQADSSQPADSKELSIKRVKNAAYHIIMGEQALLMNDAEVAQSHLESALETFPTITGLYRPLGDIYLKQNDIGKAIEYLQKALEERPSIDVLNNLGVAYMRLGDYEQAEKFLRQAFQQQPELAGSQKNLALLYQKTGRTNETVAAFEKYFRLNPKDTPMLTAYVAYLTAAGKTRDAIDFLERIDGADFLVVRLLLAKTAAQNDDVDTAVRSLREAAKVLTPRQAIAEMHDKAFNKISRTEPFEALLYQLELAAVSLSTNLSAPAEEPN
ncbi:MAG: tetratricopeptide repeat protein [Kiritimatiellales bacterium]